MANMKRDFLFLSGCKSKKGDWYAVGHIINEDRISLSVTWIKSTKEVIDDLKSLETYEVEITDFNGNFPVYDFT